MTRKTLRYYWLAAKNHKGYFLGMFLSTPIVIILRDILVPFFMAKMIGTLASGLPAEELASALLPDGLAMIACRIIGSMLLGELRLFWCWKGEVLAMYDLASLCFNKISEESMQFHSDRFSGSLVSQTNKFVSSFERFMDSLVWTILPLAVSLVSITVILVPKAPLFTLVLWIFVIIYTAIAALTFHKVSDLNEKEASAQSKQTGQLSDSISNILSVKSYAMESHERRRYANFQRSSLTASMNLMRAIITRDLLFTAVNIGIISLLVIFMMFGPAVFGLSVTTIVLIVNYSNQVMASLWDIGRIFRDFNRIFGDAHDMTEILELKDDVVDAKDAKGLKIEAGAVAFDHISFRHADAKTDVFNDFSLAVKPGERIGLVGVSGSGKTTLTKLLLRFADVDSGKIEIDDQNISKVTQKSLREAIAYVPQETTLFHRSISENIAYGKPKASAKEIERAAKLANADVFIRDLADGYDTMVGERGIKLSGGQRQRIAIARAILKDAPILVLDEATSALDSESETLIQDALEKLMKGRTSIVIAHRLSTVANLDRIVVLENGKTLDTGTHSDLLKKSGAYAKLWSLQSKNA